MGVEGIGKRIADDFKKIVIAATLIGVLFGISVAGAVYWWFRKPAPVLPEEGSYQWGSVHNHSAP